MQITIQTGSFTPGAPGNVIALLTALAAGATVKATVSVGLAGSTSSSGGILQVTATGGTTVGVPSGVLVKMYYSADGTKFDTSPMGGSIYVLPVVPGVDERQSTILDTGVYQLWLTNTDLVNGITVSSCLGGRG